MSSILCGVEQSTKLYPEEALSHHFVRVIGSGAKSLVRVLTHQLSTTQDNVRFHD